MSTTHDTRGHRGQAIAHLQGSVSRIDENTHILSKITVRHAKEYEIISSLDGNAYVLILFTVTLSVNMFLQ
jgi:hypothetical protein